MKAGTYCGSRKDIFVTLAGPYTILKKLKINIYKVSKALKDSYIVAKIRTGTKFL